jgi:hypothetical protein
LGIWGDFSEESLPSSIVHRDYFAYTCWDNFLTTVEWKVSCHNFFFLIINYNNFSYLSKKIIKFHWFNYYSYLNYQLIELKPNFY